MITWFCLPVQAECAGHNSTQVFWCIWHAQAGEAEKQKSYEVRVRMPTPVTPEVLRALSAMREVLLQQTTPERVAHRRALLVRAQTLWGFLTWRQTF